MSEVVVSEAARSVAGRELPALPTNLKPDENGNMPVSLLLFYQYIEPPWSESEHKAAVTSVINLAKQHQVNGRGRCAPEGLNCTLSASAKNLRQFCLALRRWNKVFEQTDFKITDNVYFGKRFKALTIRKVDELVAYGLAGEKAPSLQHNSAQHLDADAYHQMMSSSDAVIIDVRNAYESAIGHFAPPPGGAQLIDPKMRNSHEFPKWLNMPETKELLQGKKVMMYCTGGIRCERASALLHEIEKTSDDVSTQGIFMVRGGIERYLKTFPEGGHWKGYNYLFDRRFEQQPELKSSVALEEEIESECCLCGKPWNKYRGQFKCAMPLCKVPVLVCFECADAGVAKARPPYCPLCVAGHELRTQALPDFGDMKQKLPARLDSERSSKSARPSASLHAKATEASLRLFVGNLPLLVSATAIRGALDPGGGSGGGRGQEGGGGVHSGGGEGGSFSGGADGGVVTAVEWITDRVTGAFYGSVFVKVHSLAAAQRIVAAAAASAGIRLKGSGACKRARRLRVEFAPYQAGLGEKKKKKKKWSDRSSVEPHGSAGSKKKKEGKKEGEKEAIDFGLGGAKTNTPSEGLQASRSSSGMVKHVGSKAELERVLRVEHSSASCAVKLVCLYFTAKWCGPCQRIGPIFVALAAEFADCQCQFVQVDVDDNAEAWEAYYIKSLPTFVFFKNGQDVGRMSGADEAQLRTWVRRLRLEFAPADETDGKGEEKKGGRKGRREEVVEEDEDEDEEEGRGRKRIDGEGGKKKKRKGANRKKDEEEGEEELAG